MRRTLIIALGTAVALAMAAVAIAAVFTATGVSATTAILTADKATDVKTRTCTGSDGKEFKITNGHYTGTADFTNPATDLDGTLTIHARTTYSTSETLGYVEGSFRIKDGDSRVSGKFWGTLSGEKLVGFLEGTSHGNHARVLGNMSATFAPATGFTAGALGSTSIGPALAVIAGPPCKGAKPGKPVKPASVEGRVTGLGSGDPPSTITVTSKGPSTATCKRDASSPTTAGFPVGTKVEMKCEFVAPDWVLRGLKTHS